MKQSALKSLALALTASTIALVASTSDVLAGPIYTFNTSVGTQVSNVGTITLTQQDANHVLVGVDLLAGYGFVNTGGPHTPFTLNLSGSLAGLSISSWTTPAAGSYTNSKGNSGIFSLNGAGGTNTPAYGTFNTAIDDTAGNGSAKGYFGDLLFTLTRAGTLDTNDFIANGSGYFFSADISSNIDSGTTGAQAWALRTTPPEIDRTSTEVPEPLTISLFAAGLAGVAGLRRRKSSTKSGAAAA